MSAEKDANVLKCNYCNLVVNELLTFVQHKHEVMDTESLARICNSAFCADEIVKAKSLLYQSVSTNLRQIKRKKKEGKTNKDLVDIIEFFKSVDPEKFPTFVALDLNKLPPITFDHVDVTRLLKDITILQNEMKIVKSTYVTMDDLRKQKREIDVNLNHAIVENSYGNIGIKRGAYLPSLDYYDSGPMGLQHVDETSITGRNTTASYERNDENSKASRSFQTIAELSTDVSPTFIEIAIPSMAPMRGGEASKCDAVRSLASSDTKSNVVSSPIPVERVHERADLLVSSERDAMAGQFSSESTMPSERLHETSKGSSGMFVMKCISPPAQCEGNVLPMSTRNAPTTNRSYAACTAEEGEWKQPEVNSEWIQVQNNRYKNRFVGKKGSAIITPQCKFRAADVKLPMFINNVDKGASPSDIEQYIKHRTQVSVTLERISMRQEKEYDAYKILIPKHKLSLFMDDKMWPEGVTFRRFIDFGSRKYKNNYNERKPNG